MLSTIGWIDHAFFAGLSRSDRPTRWSISARRRSRTMKPTFAPQAQVYGQARHKTILQIRIVRLGPQLAAKKVLRLGVQKGPPVGSFASGGTTGQPSPLSRANATSTLRYGRMRTSPSLGTAVVILFAFNPASGSCSLFGQGRRRVVEVQKEAEEARGFERQSEEGDLNAVEYGGDFGWALRAASLIAARTSVGSPSERTSRPLP
jgi:hypothetical protein